MMMVPTARIVAAAASSAILLTVASQCARNMIQTARIRSSSSSLPSQEQQQCSSIASLLALPENDDDDDSKSTTNEIVDQLKNNMNREQLLQLFLESEAPTPLELSEIICGSEGAGSAEWNGILLDNNSKIMDLSSNIMTHTLFGGIGLPWRILGDKSKKGMWKGKAFSKPLSSSTMITAIKGKGINRFASSSSSSTTANNINNNNNNNNMFQRHEFDYSIEDSKLLPGTKCLQLKYANYQWSPISLWYTMMDELRVVAIPGSSSNNNKILIGMGWMGWSGGSLNCSPFVCWRDDDDALYSTTVATKITDE